MSLLLGLEPFQKLGVVGGWWWSKGILEFHFGPDLGLRLEAGTKLNNRQYQFAAWIPTLPKMRDEKSFK